jgi:protein SCO1/2
MGSWSPILASGGREPPVRRQQGAHAPRSPLAIALFLVLLGAAPSRAEPPLPPVLRSVGFDQRLDEQVPLDLAFRDEAGRAVRLGDYFDGKPVILVLAYFRCPQLCTEVLNGLVRAMLDLPLELGKDFRVVTVSFDARETPEMAAAKKKTYLERYGRPGAENGWHFLTGEEGAIKRLTDAVGFRYSYDARNDQFAHASGIMVLTPTGKVSRYFYDIRYSPRDLRLGLVEASAGRIGSAVDQILLYCFHYDPIEGKYGATIMNFVRLGGVLTILALAVFMAVLWRRERKAPSPPTPLPQRGEGSKK